jgi:5-deoxy-glucuronate isomerase
MHYSSENLLIPSADHGQSGVFAQVSAQQAGWEYLNMEIRRFHSGQTWESTTGDYEYGHVILGGECHVHTSRGNFQNIGKRRTVFDGKPYAVYVPRHTDFTIMALTESLEVATCWAATDQDHPLQLVTPETSRVELRGGGNASRQINSIFPPGFDCHRLVCVEVYTPGGNWSSYPPHKHDVHRVDEHGTVIEADLEEIYFYKHDKPDGYAYQRVYTDDRDIDALVLARNHDTVLVPKGYHPVVSAHGYTTYYLNFLAGSAQSLANADDPAYAWIKNTWSTLDPRLPIVT